MQTVIDSNPTIISYSRVSSVKQVTGTGLAQQRDNKLLERLSFKYSLPIDERVFSDEGRSGYKGDHLDHDFGKIQNLIKSGSIVKGSMLAITSLDRISRQRTNHALELFLSVLNSGIKIYTAIDDKLYEPESPNLTGDLIVSIIILAQAHEESLKKSKRTTGHALQMIKRHNEGKRSPEGYSYSIKSVGSEPFWIDAKDGVVKPHPELYQAAQDVISQIKRGLGTRRILMFLREHYPQRSWSAEIPKKITKTDMLAGIKTVTLEGIDYNLENYFPALVSIEELEQIRALRKKRYTPRSASQHISVITGMNIAYCANCDATVGANYAKSRNSMSYFCNGKKRQATNCEGWNVKTEYVEQGLIQLAQWIIWQEVEANTSDESGSFTALESQISTKVEQIETATSQWLSLGMPQAIGHQIKKFEDEKTTLEQELAAIKIESVALPQATSEDWAKVDKSFMEVQEDDKRLVLRELIRSSFKRIELYKVKRGEFTLAVYVAGNEEPYQIMVKNGLVHVRHLPDNPLSTQAIEGNVFTKKEMNNMLNLGKK